MSMQNSPHIDSQPYSEPSEQYPTFSDDLEALHGQEAELAVEKNAKGIVIQHRTWTSQEVFRSEDDRSCGLSSLCELCNDMP